ncbi:MAG: NCS2 family permease [Candidatus Latescibacteria bacterium]|nr:NCS2 family permease [Candidatus Latescibacterota bacterium]
MVGDKRNEILAGIIGFAAVIPLCFASLHLFRLITNDAEMIFLGICLSAGIFTIVASLFSRAPVIFAPNLGLIALLVYSIYGGTGQSLTQALSMFALSGVIIFILGLTRVGEGVQACVPESLYAGITSSVGFLLIATGLREGGLVTTHPVTLITLGDLVTRSPVITLCGVGTAVFILARGYRHALIWGLTVSLIAAWFLGALGQNEDWIGEALALQSPVQLIDYVWIPETYSFVPSVILVTLVETTAVLLCLLGIMQRQFSEWKVRARRLWMITGIAGILSPILGAPGPMLSSQGLFSKLAGGKTWVSGVVAGTLVALAAVLPLPAAIIGDGYHIGNDVWLHPVTAALVLAGGLLCVESFSRVDWKQLETSIPTLVMCCVTGLSFSIVNGFGLGVLTYILIQVSRGEIRSLLPLILYISPLLVMRLLLL